MSLLERVVSEPIFLRVGWAVLHSLWLGVLVAVLLGVVLAMLRRHSANARYVAVCAALALMAVATVVTAVRVTVSSPVLPPLSSTVPNVALEPTETEPDVPLPESSVTKTNPSAVVFPARFLTERLGGILAPCVPWAAVCWGIGVLTMATWHFGGWVYVRRLVRTGTERATEQWNDVFNMLVWRFRLKRRVRLLTSTTIRTPSVIGWLRPVLLMPLTVLTALTSEEIEALLAHELAHVRRHDYLVNLIQTAVEMLLFYHPVVWWMSRRIRIERENCCDDLAIDACPNRLIYARALANLVDLGSARGTAVAASGASLLDRIKRLLAHPETPSHPWCRGLAGGVGVLLCLAVVISVSCLPSSPTREKKAVSADAPAAQPKREGDWLVGTWVHERTDSPGPDEPPYLVIQLGADGRWANASLWGTPQKPVKVTVSEHGARWDLTQGRMRESFRNGNEEPGPGMAYYLDMRLGAESIPGSHEMLRTDADTIVFYSFISVLMSTEYHRADPKVAMALSSFLRDPSSEP